MHIIAQILVAHSTHFLKNVLPERVDYSNKAGPRCAEKELGKLTLFTFGANPFWHDKLFFLQNLLQ